MVDLYFVIDNKTNTRLTLNSLTLTGLTIFQYIIQCTYMSLPNRNCKIITAIIIIVY